MEEQNWLLNKYGKSVVSQEEAAMELGVDVADVQEVIASGDLASKKIGSKVVISLASLVSYLNGFLPDSTNNFANSTLTSTNAEITLVEDDVEMSSGCVTYVTKSNRWLYQVDLGKNSDGKRIRKSKSFISEAEARVATDLLN